MEGPPTARLAGRTVLVSGGSSGIGLATARRLGEEGARVWILGSRPESVERALAEFGAAGGCACDVGDGEAVERAVDRARAALGPLDGAFVNAGIDGEDRPALELGLEHFRRVLEVNVLGAFAVARAVARQAPRGAALVLNASVNGRRPEARFADYNASKAAVVSLAQTLALELAEREVAVTAICPGYVRTPMTATYLDDPPLAAELLAEIPAGRFGEPEEIAALVAFLLRREAAYVSGGVVAIDGGRGI